MTGVGDPGSLSVAGGLLLRVATGLRSDSSLARTAYAGLQGEWVGRASVAARRRGDLLAAATRTAADEAAAVGVLLQRHSTDLAGLLDEEATMVTRGASDGFVVTEAGVALAPGLRGVADPAVIARTETQRAALDAGWRDLQRRLTTSRMSLQAALTDSADRLAASAHSLRQR